MQAGIAPRADWYRYCAAVRARYDLSYATIRTGRTRTACIARSVLLRLFRDASGESVREIARRIRLAPSSTANAIDRIDLYADTGRLGAIREDMDAIKAALGAARTVRP